MKSRITETCLYRRCLPLLLNPTRELAFGPFNSSTQRRWLKPINSAQTRLETRTIDLKLDKFTTHFKTLTVFRQINHLISTRKHSRFVSLQSMSKWNNVVGLNITISQFVRKYPHVFELFKHPVSKSICCRITRKMMDLIKMEDYVVRELELECVMRLKKLLMMSANSKLHVHALRLIRRELGLPEDFRDSLIGKYSNDFKLVDLEIVELVYRDETLGVAEIEKWRENEYREKWLSEFETKYAFPICFPTGFKMEKGFRVELKNWQRLHYMKPYEKKKEVVRVRTCGGIDRFEKRVVGILHELLSLTVEKMVEVERLAHFKKDFDMETNVRELILKHPGIFYISTKGTMQLVFLRQAYCKGCLTETNPIFEVRKKMLDLFLLGCRNTTELQVSREDKEGHNVIYNENKGGTTENKGGTTEKKSGKTEKKSGTTDGDWIIPILNDFQQNE